ncbi:hypothetical protein [Novosphingobium terrae]|uniref:hypothetical protein n=1 Tax=Novosphingobium terrae TaxID=2726189 RepID=UPI00197E672E|nr:hypothetical protein [Novosphingobium terrae]
MAGGVRVIYISFGMLKSASTLTYQIIEEILRQAGRPPLMLGAPLRPALSVTNYFDTIDGALIQQIQSMASGRDVVLKTHQLPAPEVLAMIAQGDILASATLRDPREIALSMIDHGDRSRRWHIPEFSECVTLEDCLPSIDHQVATLQALCEVPGVLPLTYAAICFEMRETIALLARQIGVSIDPAAVEAVFADTRMIGQFNQGRKDRFHDMAPEDSATFLKRYAPFHAAFLPAPKPSAGRPASAPKAVRGQWYQVVIDLRRLWHTRRPMARLPAR